MFYNALTKAPYSAKNQQLLLEAALVAGIEGFEVAGFKQWIDLGRVVAKGQHGTKILMIVDKKDETQVAAGAENPDKRKVIKGRAVFFRSQTIELGAGPSPEPEAAPISELTTDQQVREILPPTHGFAIAAKFRQMADGLADKIERAFGDRLENTPKRRREAASQRLEGARLRRTQQALLALAKLHDTGAVPPDLAAVTTKQRVYELCATALDGSNCGYYDAPRDTGQPRESSPEALAMWALLSVDPNEAKAEELRRNVASVRQSGIPGFFATPAPLVERMIDEAALRDGMTVLEPSAGDGAIASEVSQRFPGASVTAVEQNSRLCEILNAKGLSAQQSDFLQYDSAERFDRVLMNPPFERMQDIDHVRHAYDLLSENGRLVAIMSPAGFYRTDRKAQEFREWFNSVGGYEEEIPAGAFKASGTGVATRLVVIER